MILEPVLQQAKDLVDHALSHAEKWKHQNAGRKLIGCFPVYTPFPLMEAAGALPVRLFGGGTTIEIDHADSRIQSFVCSIARSTLELGLIGRLSEFDGMVFPSICDVSKNLAGVWKRNFPDSYVDYLHLPQNIHSPASKRYYASELQRFKTNLEEFTGRNITDSSLNIAIENQNENIALIETLYSIRTAQPAAISSIQLYLLLRAGAVLPRAEHSMLLREAIENLPANQKPRDSIRVLVEGAFCEQPPLEFIEVLEAAGCYIVDDDFMKGYRWFQSPIPVDGNPLQALADHYIDHGAPVAVRHCGNERWRNIADRARQLKADGVIFCAAKFCEPAMFDYVLLKQELDQIKIPNLYMEFEEKMTVFDSIRTQVETFVESILFFD